MPTPIENNTASLETVMGKINGVSSEVNTQATQIEEIMTLLEGKTYDSASLQPKVVTPTAVTQTVTPDSGYEGLSVVTVNGDSDLVAENIKSGVNIFGVDGTYEGSGGGGEVSTCTVTAYEENSITMYINYSSFENGAIVAHGDVACSGGEITLQNVVCGSLISFYYDCAGTINTYPTVDGGVTVLSRHEASSGAYCATLIAPETANATGYFDPGSLW